MMNRKIHGINTHYWIDYNKFMYEKHYMNCVDASLLNLGGQVEIDRELIAETKTVEEYKEKYNEKYK